MDASEDPIFERLINQASGTDIAHVLAFTQSNPNDTIFEPTTDEDDTPALSRDSILS